MEIIIERVNNLKERFDVNYYKKEYKEIERKLNNSKYEIKKIKDVAEVKGGKRIPKELNFEEDKTSNPYIRVVDFADLSVDLKNLKYINDLTFSKIKNYTISTDDIYLSNAGTIGLVGIIPKELNNKSLTENSLKITLMDKKSLDQRYLMYLLDSSIMQKQLEKETLIAGVPKLSLERVENLNIIHPSKDVQKKIVNIMDDAYKVKEDNEVEAKNLIDSIDDYLLKELEVEKPNLDNKKIFNVKINKLLNDRFDVQFHKDGYKKIEKALNSGKYELKKLNDITDYIKKGVEVGSKEYAEEGYLFFRVSNIKNFNVDLKNNSKFIDEQMYIKNIECKPLKNEVLFSKDGSIANSVVLENEFEGILSSAIIRIKPFKELNNYFLSYMLGNKYFKLLFEKLSIGQIIKHLNMEEIENFKVPLPPKAIQDKIAKEVKNRLDEAEKLKEEGDAGVKKAKEEVENILLN